MEQPINIENREKYFEVSTNGFSKERILSNISNGMKIPFILSHKDFKIFLSNTTHYDIWKQNQVSGEIEEGYFYLKNKKLHFVKASWHYDFDRNGKLGTNEIIRSKIKEFLVKSGFNLENYYSDY